MPHINIQYSQNLQPDIDMQHFCETIRQTCLTIEAFPMAGIRVRATAVDYYAIADGNPAHGFIDIIVRLREGRSTEIKQAAIQDIFDTAKQFLEPAFERRSIALSAEIIDINAELSPKFGTIRAHLKNEG